MLLIDGVKYELWTPSSEDEFEQVIKAHTQDIFGEKSIYLDMKQKLKSGSGIGSIPDGYVIMLGDSPQWHIVEVELSSHPLHEHIVSQVSKFINGIKNPLTRAEILGAMYAEISKDDFLNLKVKKAIGPIEIHKFLSDLILQLPILTIIIEEDTKGLRETISTLAYPEIKVVEFQTFTRERVGLPVHAHLFEPLYKRVIFIKPEFPPPQPSENSLEVTLQPSYIESYCIYIPAAKKHLFPTFNTTLELDTDIGLIEIGFSIDSWGIWLSKGLAPWFKSHPQLKAGDRLIITVIEPMKRYFLEVVK